jgi:HlyD family secretion protein
MTLNRKSLVLAGAAVLIAGVLYVLLKPAVIDVEVAAVAPRTLTVVVEEQGRTRARDPFIVAAPIAGRLLRPALEAGDQVVEGQSIARIALAADDPRTEAIAQANLNAAEARREAAQAALLEAQSAHARALREEQRREELFKTGVTTAEERDYYLQLTDAAEARLLSTRASLQAAQAEVDSARSQLPGSNWDDAAAIQAVPAPVGGTVYQVYEENERVVQAGAPLYAISRDDVLEVVVDLLTQDAIQVRAGQTLLISGWGGTEVLQGEVTRVEPQAFTKISALGVEEQRVNVIGSLGTVPAGLGAEYRIDAAIVVWEEDGVLTLPASAVFQRANRWQAFVMDDGRARLRELDTGRRNRDYVQVLDGLAEGAEVILFPSDLISDGVRVTAEPGQE